MGANRYEFQLASSHTFGPCAPGPQDDAYPRGVAGHLASVGHRHAVLPVRARPCTRAERRADAVERAVRLQHALDEPADAARGGTRPDSLDAGGRRDGIPGLVRRAGQDLQDADHGRRRARGRHAAPGAEVDRNAALADPGDPRALRERPQRAALRLVRPVEPRLHVDEHAVRRRRALGCGNDLRHDFDGGRTGRASRDARIHVQRRHGPQRR